MIRCDGCGRALTDPASIRARLGPECATKDSLRLRRVRAMRDLVDRRTPDAELAAAILRRMDAGQPLSVRQKRFRDAHVGGLVPMPGDGDFVCLCTTSDAGMGHAAHCLRGQKTRAVEAQ